MFEQKFPKQVKPKSEGDCEISVTKTKTGKKIRFKGNCRKEQIEIFAKNNGVDLDED